MQIPRFWAKADLEAISADRRAFGLTQWGWSSRSIEDAARHAQERVDELADKLASGHDPQESYAYGRTPVREQWLDEIQDASGETIGVLTRNVYGSVVLNTSDVMFLDIDLPQRWNMGLLGRLFGRKKEDPADKILNWLHSILPRLTTSGFRVYRTYAGLRLLSHDSGHTADSEEIQSLMQQLNVDPAYRHLCKLQKCFRARLTPKPWRCQCKHPPGKYPREDPEVANAFESWLADYDQRITRYATCHYLETIGSDVSDARATMVRTLHDELTMISTDKPLA